MAADFLGLRSFARSEHKRRRIVRWGIAQAPVQIDLFDYQTDPAGAQSIAASQPQVVTDLLSLLP